MDKILPIWQPVGYSTHIISKKVAQKFDMKTSHTGTLDPMAEGVIVVLLGEERFKKKEYAKWLKRYEFDIAFGISTDTYDGLGLITDTLNLATLDIQKERLENIIQDFEGLYIQEVPPYSAIKREGKPLHWYARRGLIDEIEVPKRTGQIHEIKLKELKKIFIPDLIENLLDKIKKVSGDLRQEIILDQWKSFTFEEGNISSEYIFQATIEVQITKGLYIRSLSQDICRELSVPGFVARLVRTKNGSYDKTNSRMLIEIFGSDFRDKYDFISRFKS